MGGSPYFESKIHLDKNPTNGKFGKFPHKVSKMKKKIEIKEKVENVLEEKVRG